MNMLMLSCEEATFLISVKSFKKLKFKERLQLRMHLLACIYCERFDKQNTAIDHGLNELLKGGHSHSQCMSDEKKESIQRALDQSLEE